MPAPGDQHAIVANPFEEPRMRMSEYTAQEIATLQSRLEKQLGPEYLSSRAGPSGQKVHYIAAEKCIALANDVFGFNGWSSSIQNIQVDFADENPQTMKVSVGLSVVVRVTLRDGSYHEDIGYGHIENCKGKAAAFEKAKKEGTTDALKRALRNFGNVLGNCIYDKEYLAKVTKIKVGPTKFNPDGLHRHPDFVKKEIKALDVPLKIEQEDHLEGVSSDALEELLCDMDESDFCVPEDGHPDEVVLPAQISSGERTVTTVTNTTSSNSQQSAGANGPQGQQHQHQQQPARIMGRSTSAGYNNNQPQRAPQTPNNGGQMMSNRQGGPQQPNNNNGMGGRPGGQPQNSMNRGQQQQQQNAHNNNHSTNNAARVANNNSGRQTPPVGEPFTTTANDDKFQIPPGGATFFSAKAVNGIAEEVMLSNQPLPLGVSAPVFNPRLESPSIRKTPGFDHSRTVSILRSEVDAGAESDKSKPKPKPPGQMDDWPAPGGPGQGQGQNQGQRPHPNAGRQMGAGGGTPGGPGGRGQQQQQQQQPNNNQHYRGGPGARVVGAPPGAAPSPHALRSNSFRSPMVGGAGKRPLPNDGGGAGGQQQHQQQQQAGAGGGAGGGAVSIGPGGARSPLSDVSNVGGGQAASGPDTKRIRLAG